MRVERNPVYKVMYDILRYFNINSYIGYGTRNIQNLIYIIQFKLDLSYFFGWYGNRPFSPGLERDVINLFNSLLVDSVRLEYSNDHRKLKSYVYDSLDFIKEIIPDVNEFKYLEDVAAYLFLRKESKYSHQEAKDYLLSYGCVNNLDEINTKVWNLLCKSD